MVTALSLVALAMVGPIAGCDDPRSAVAPTLSYSIRLFEMDGLGWRGEVHGMLTPVAHQGAAAVWTGPTAALEVIESRAARTVASPDFLAGPGVPAEVRTGRSIAYVADLERVADGPKGFAHVMTYKPTLGQVEERFHVRIVGEPRGQGVLAEVEVEDVWLRSMSSYELRETLAPEGAKPGAEGVAHVQVPEMAAGAVSGTWLVPNDGLLVLGLGASAGSEPGKTVDRVAIIRVERDDDAPETPEAVAWVEPMAPSPSMPGLMPPPIPANWRPSPAEFAAWTAPTPPAPPRTYREIARSIDLVSEPSNVPSTLTGHSMSGAEIVTWALAWQSALKATQHPAAGRIVPNEPARTPADDVAPAPPEAPVAVALRSPKTPGRSLPTPIDSEGNVVALPPLPVEEPLFAEDSAESRPSPQALVRSQLSAPAVSPSPESDRLALHKAIASEAPKRLSIELSLSVRRVPAPAPMPAIEPTEPLAKAVRAAFDTAARRASVRAVESKRKAEPKRTSSTNCCPCCSEDSKGEGSASKASKPAVDDHAVRTEYEPPKPGELQLVVGLTPMPMMPMASCNPFRIRLPIGHFGLIEVRSTRDKFTYPLGAFW